MSAGRISSVLSELSPAPPRDHLLWCELGPKSTQTRGGCSVIGAVPGTPCTTKTGLGGLGGFGVGPCGGSFCMLNLYFTAGGLSNSNGLFGCSVPTLPGAISALA